MRAEAETTTDHEKIRQWAEQRGGKPTCVKGTGSKTDSGLLRIDFPGFSGEGKLKEIPWDDWFEKFDEKNLAFLYQDRTQAGKTSRFFKLVNRAAERDQPRSRRTSGQASAKTRSQRLRSRGGTQPKSRTRSGRPSAKSSAGPKASKSSRMSSSRSRTRANSRTSRVSNTRRSGSTARSRSNRRG